MTIKCSLQKKDEWIEIFPYGVTVSLDPSRPVLIFKDKKEMNVLPVWLSPIDAGIALTEKDSKTLDSTPHNLTQKILKPLGVKLEKCLFTEVIGHQQFVNLEFSGSEKLKSLRSRADESMSFCLNAKCRFYCTEEYIESCRSVEGEIFQDQIQKDYHPGSERPRYLN